MTIRKYKYIRHYKEDCKIYIYALIDPDSLLVRYIGKTTNPKKRESEHNNRKGNSAKDKWIESLTGQKKRPIFEIIEECDINNWHKRERFYLDKFNSHEHPLLNMRNGVTYREKEIEELLLKGIFYKAYYKKDSEKFFVVVALENGDYYFVKGIRGNLEYYHIAWNNYYGHIIPKESYIYNTDLSNLPILPENIREEKRIKGI
jgi:hypothetical protein